MPPFNGESEREILKKVKAGVISFQSPVWESVSRHAKEFVQSLINPKVSDRLTAAQALQSNWIKKSTKELKNNVFNEATAHALSNL